MPPKGKQTNEEEPPDVRQQPQGPAPSPPPGPTSQRIEAREGSTVSGVIQVAGNLIKVVKIVYSPLVDVRVVLIAGGLLLILLWLYLRSLPTTYAEFVLDNGPLQDPRQLNQLSGVLHEELARSLPDAALALRVFGENCGQTRQLVNFSRGNAPKVAEELEEVQPVANADVTEAIRQALNDVLKKPANRPRIVVAVTWGGDDCGHDLNEALKAYEEQLGDAVSLFIYSFETPIAVSQPGVQSTFFPDLTQFRPELERVVGALEKQEIPAITPTIPLPCAAYCTSSGRGGTEEIPVSPPCLAAKIRIDMTRRTWVGVEQFGFSLWEVEAYGPDDPGENLITGGTAFASSVEGDNRENYDPNLTIDGFMSTRWSSDFYEPQWLEVILPQAAMVDRVVLKWQLAYAEEYCVYIFPE